VIVFFYWSSTELKGFTELDEYGQSFNLANYVKGCCGFVVEDPRLNGLFNYNVKLKTEKMQFIAVKNF
jgi:hypothetical protein